MAINNYTVKEALNVKLGQVGSTLIVDTTAYTGTYTAITFITNSTFTTLTDASMDGGSISGVTFPAGTTIYGQFTAITLATGSAIAYKG